MRMFVLLSLLLFVLVLTSCKTIPLTGDAVAVSDIKENVSEVTSEAVVTNNEVIVSQEEVSAKVEGVNSAKVCPQDEALIKSICDSNRDKTQECELNPISGCYAPKDIVDVCKLTEIAGKQVYRTDACGSQCGDGDCLEVQNSHQTCFTCETYQYLCPYGTERNECPSTCDACDEIKELDDGTKCMQCVTYKCPSEQTKTRAECDSKCDGSCSLGATDREFQCWKCNIECGTYCSGRGMVSISGSTEEDFVNDILNEDPEGVCKQNVVGNVGVVNALGCSCADADIEYSGDVICTRTICGDVACGEEISCGDELTASCEWIGWGWNGEEFNPRYRTINRAHGEEILFGIVSGSLPEG